MKLGLGRRGVQGGARMGRGGVQGGARIGEGRVVQFRGADGQRGVKFQELIELDTNLFGNRGFPLETGLF